jgi:hypothetical protein
MSDGDLPKPVEDAVREQERRDAVIAKVDAPLGGEPAPEPVSPQQAFVDRMREQREREEVREQRIRAATFQHSEATADEPDPLRELAREQDARRRRLRRRVPR